MQRQRRADQMDLKLGTINVRLARFGVPFALTRLGNYKKGEFQIEDVISVFMHRNLKLSIVFLLKRPHTGELIEHWAQFNSTYSTEALSGHIIVPVVNGDKFLMIRAYGAFIGKTPLCFPRGFIPDAEEDMTAEQVSLSILDRKVMDVVLSIGGSLTGEPRLLQTKKGTMALADDHSTSGNLLTVSVVNITFDEMKFAGLGRKARHVQLVPCEEFLRYVQYGEIMDLHSLSAFVGYEADKLG